MLIYIKAAIVRLRNNARISYQQIVLGLVGWETKASTSLCVFLYIGLCQYDVNLFISIDDILACIFLFNVNRLHFDFSLQIQQCILPV